jgi:hydroxyethylthiazole kinase-like uncharacterized protein yjeF
MSGPELLSVVQMGEADRLAVESGVPSLDLMEMAGSHVAAEVREHAPSGDVAILCGPGNNGGDGYVAARLLKSEGRNVWVESYGDPAQLKGDAREMFRRWDGTTRPISAQRTSAIVVDALFGAGLSRPLENDLGSIVDALNTSGTPVIAVDVPSGLSGDFGRVLGNSCVRARATVTFFRKKPGHLLMPGREYCGETKVVDIGIPGDVLQTIRPTSFESGLSLWAEEFPWPALKAHKYNRGHAVVVSGPAHATGAARLAARGALRVGAGLVSVASGREAQSVHAAHLTAIMIKPCDDAKELAALLGDKRFNAVVIGPGLGIGAVTKDLVAAALQSAAAVVLDADALTSFADSPRELFSQIGERTVLTPHEGEFERIFPGILESSASRLEAALAASAHAKCIVLLKGPDTVIATPDGLAAINANAPPWLATAGAGDVLAGFVAGLLAQGMPPFAAASAAAWLHGEAANYFGAGLIAEDLPEMLPDVLADLQAANALSERAGNGF